MAANNKKPKICIITTQDISLNKMFPEFYPLLLAKGYEVVGICADGPHVEKVRQQGVRVITVPMIPGITPIRDLRCLWMLYRIFKAEKFDLIHYSTLKASFLAAIAGHLTGCPALVYTIRGFHIFTGLKKFVTKSCDKIAARLADYIIAISSSLKDKLVEEGIASANRINVLGAGSSKGVNLEQFQLNEKTKSCAEKIRRDSGISDNDIVLGYAGRLTVKKGIVEFLTAFANIRKSNDKVHLMVIGGQDKRRPLPAEFIEQMDTNPHIHKIAWTDDIANYMAATDIFVLPTYHDGFGNVLIEAAALEKPVIGTDGPGSRDALQDGVNGILVPVRDVMSLEKALKELIENPTKRKQMGSNGRKWVSENFDRREVWGRLIEVYDKMLRKSRK